MIDLNRIRSIKVLEEMKRDLTEFITNPDVLAVYLAEDCGEEDYEADKEQAAELLELVERRMKSLSRFLKGQEERSGSRQQKKLATKASPSEQ